MFRSLVSVLTLLMMCLPLMAEDPKQAELAKKPQWQRMLTGEDAKKAEKLEKRIEELETTNDYEEAIRSGEELVDLRRQLQGADHYEVKDAEQDLVALKKIAVLQVKERRNWRTVISRSRDANQLIAKRQYSKAEELHREILDIHRKVLGEEHARTASRYEILADTLIFQTKVIEAQFLYQKAIEIYRKVLGETHVSTAASYNNLALKLTAQSKFVEAIPLFEKSLYALRISVGEENEYTARCYGNLANTFILQGRPAESTPYHEKALTITRKVFGENHISTARCYNNLAGSLQERGMFAEAKPLIEISLDFHSKFLGEKHTLTAGILNNLARNLHKQGQFENAGALFQKALDIRRQLLGDLHPDTAASYDYMAQSMSDRGRTEEAATYYQKALDIHRRILGETHLFTACSYYNLAMNSAIRRDNASAKSTLIDGIRAYENSRLRIATGLERSNNMIVNPRHLLVCLLTLAEPRTAWQHLEHTLARGLFDHQSSTTRLTIEEQRTQQQAREQLETLQPLILNLAIKSRRTGTQDEELQVFLTQRRQCEETVSRLSVLDSERAVEPGDRIQAALSTDAAILYWVDVTNHTGRVQEHWGCVVRSTGDPRWVRLPGTDEKGAWTKTDSEMPVQFRESLPTFREIGPLAQRLHAQRIAPLLPYLKSAKTLHVVGTHSMAGIPIEALISDFKVNYVPSGSYLARLKAQRANDARQLFALGDPVFPEAAAKTFAPQLPTSGILITQVVPGGVGDKARLQSGDVLLKYSEQELNSIDDLRKTVAANEKAEKITLTIWRDGKTNTKEVSPGKLGIVPDTEPAPQAIAARRKANEQLAKLSRGGDWTELPGTAAELGSLQTLFPQAMVLSRKDASPKKLEELVKADKLKDYRYLHFATHGEANSVMAFQSSLILHGDDKSVARLTAREILDTWKLNAELVTLSACETAIGKDGGGDGLLGFAQAFLTAGARSVCLSLWKVDDGATALLMERFYQNLLGKRDGLTKPMGKADALHEAKQWLRNLTTEEAATRLATISKGVSRGAGAKAVELTPPKPAADAKPEAAKKPFDHPRYWAAFILIGDPN